jgi:putative colanic acid biosynthesis acetyltransferase WcaF
MDQQSSLELRKSRAAPPPLRRRLWRVAWAVVEMTLFRYSFHTSNAWRARLLRSFGAQIGSGCTVRRTARVYYPWNLRMGSVSALGDRAEVYNLGTVTIGDRVIVSQEAYLCAGTHDYRDPGMPLLTPPITIKSDAWVCARAFVGPGVTIGEGAILGAAAVAMRDVPDWTIVAGNPATFIRTRERLHE